MAARAQIHFWGARALYLGPAFGLSPHRNAVGVLCIGIDRPFQFAADADEGGKDYVHCRSLFIPPNTLHHLIVDAGLMAFLYVDALSDDCDRLMRLARCGNARAAYDLTNEALLFPVLQALASGNIAWSKARVDLGTALGFRRPAAPDLRIVDALRTMRETPGQPHDLASLASAARLSEGRFLHLFKQATGVPFRRYKIWIRMGAALQTIGKGALLTEAAHEAGFASSAHFSAAFNEMFGLAPSQLKGRGFAIVADESTG